MDAKPAVGVPVQAPPAPQKMVQANYLQDGSRTGQWLLSRPSSTDSRLIVDFFPDSCCGPAFVLKEQDATVVPPALAARGISQEDWVQWMDTFKSTVNANHISVTTCITCSLLIVPFPCICYKLIKQQHQVQLFCEEINRTLFEPRGMYFKTQSSSITIDTGDSSYTENCYWIAISLTPEDAAQLKASPHLFSGYCGTHEGCCGCWEGFVKWWCCCGQETQF